MAFSKASTYRLLGHTAPFDPTHTFVASWALHPVLHGMIRLIFSLYAFTAIIYSFTWFSDNIDIYHLRDISEPNYTVVIGSSAIGRSFSYFTYLSYWGQAFYFFVSAVHTFTYARTGTSWLHTRFPPFLQLLHSLYYAMVTCFPILVTIAFWATMYAGGWYTVTFDMWANLSIHAMNSFMAAFEIIFPTTEPLAWMHLPVLMVVLSLYLGLAYLSRATGGFWVYEWLDPEFGYGKIIAHIAGYTAAIVVIFVVVRYAIWLRNWLLMKYQSRRGCMALGPSEKTTRLNPSPSGSRGVLLGDVEAQAEHGQVAPPQTMASLPCAPPLSAVV